MDHQSLEYPVVTRMESIFTVENSIILGALGSLGTLGALWYFGRKRMKEVQENMPTEEYSNEEIANDRVKEVWAYVGGGLVITTASASWFYHTFLGQSESGISSDRPYYFMTIGGITGLVSLMTTLYCPKTSLVAKHINWGIFNISMGATISPFGIFGSPLLVKAGALTATVVGSLSAIALSTTMSGSFLWLGAPLFISLNILTAARFLEMIFPRLQTSAWDDFMLLGGLLTFGGYLLHDTQAVLHKAKREPETHWDPINESMNLYLDIFNLAVRITKVLLKGEKKKKE